MVNRVDSGEAMCKNGGEHWKKKWRNEQKVKKKNEEFVEINWIEEKSFIKSVVVSTVERGMQCFRLTIDKIVCHMHEISVSFFVSFFFHIFHSVHAIVPSVVLPVSFLYRNSIDFIRNLGIWEEKKKSHIFDFKIAHCTVWRTSTFTSVNGNWERTFYFLLFF